MIVFIQLAGKASMNRWMAKLTMRLSRRNRSANSRVAQAWCRWLAFTQSESVCWVSNHM